MGLFSWVTGIFSENASATRTRDADIFFDDLASPFMSNPPPADTDISVHAFLNNDMTQNPMAEMSITDLNPINPASGLPMMDGIAGLDIAGNPWGTDFSNSSLTGHGFMDDHALSSHDTFASIDDSFSHSSSVDDSFNSSHDTFSSGGGFDNW